MRNFLLLVFLSCFSLVALAQDDESPNTFNRENLFIGGNFGFSFGSSVTQLNISPQVGYRFSEFFAAGVGINGIYTSFKYAGFKERYTVGGLNVFGRIYPIDNIFLQLQPEANYVSGRLIYNDGREDFKLDGKVVPSLIGGVGALLPTGGRGGMMLMLQYDILQNERSPYSTRPFFNIGYVVGL